MKTKLRILLQLSFVLLLSSCTKEKTENSDLTGMPIGKWRLIEIYNGYANGGSFTWDSVAANTSHLLEFTAGGQYSKKEANSSGQQCSGTYQVLSNNALEIISSCQNGVEKATISELANQNLILDYKVREGFIRYKYVAEK